MTRHTRMAQRVRNSPQRQRYLARKHSWRLYRCPLCDYAIRIKGEAVNPVCPEPVHAEAPAMVRAAADRVYISGPELRAIWAREASLDAPVHPARPVPWWARFHPEKLIAKRSQVAGTTIVPHDQGRS